MVHIRERQMSFNRTPYSGDEKCWPSIYQTTKIKSLESVIEWHNILSCGFPNEISLVVYY